MPEVAALSIIILLLSIIIHEVAHGYVALLFGDHTAERAGRLTLNPIPHIDPIGTILLPLLLILSGSPIFFGWAKPVPVNPLNFSDIRRGELFTSIAGILANLSLAIIGALLLHSMGATNFVLTRTLQFMVDINLLLAVFNLLPIPPLDGSKVLLSLLPYSAAREFEKLEQYGFILLLMLMFIPIGGTSLLNYYLQITTSVLKIILGV
jgi:Zn-dependent protease